ncbi:MAG: 4Fe-4S binding protein [Gammaproteobacteria bacterium]
MSKLVSSGMLKHYTCFSSSELVGPDAAAPVLYRSRGRLLVVAAHLESFAMLDAIPRDLQVLILFTEPVRVEIEQGLSERKLNWLAAAAQLRVDGYLGNFRVEAGFEAEPQTQHFEVDLVLDLLETPLLSLRVKPIGYFSRLPRGEPALETIAQLGEWVGEFEKPKFFELDASLCAHQSSGIPGCSACIDHCPAQAVTSRAGKISVDPYLCQGCGDCACACPSGAIRYHYPPPETLLNRIRAELAGSSPCRIRPCVVVFHDGEIGRNWRTDSERSVDWDFLIVELESPSAAGIEVWLASLAYGASAVAIVAGGNPQSRCALDNQVHYANQILEGAGLPASIRLLGAFGEIGAFIGGLPLEPPRKPATFIGLRDKRTVARLALDYLTESRDPAPQAVILSEGAPFGEIVVDSERCTLCMACVSVCPERALSDGVDEPRLNLIEANCVQCGICKKACPEQAIELRPRYLFSSREARKARLLNRDTPFCCLSCGKPFATGKVIQRITERLKSHPMFQGEHLRRLMLCDECRVKSFFPARNKERPE